MDSGDGGAEEEFWERASGTDMERAIPVDPEVTTSEKEAEQSETVELDVEPGPGSADTADGDHVGTLQDEDGDSPGMRDKVAAAGSAEEVLVSENCATGESRESSSQALPETEKPHASADVAESVLNKAEGDSLEAESAGLGQLQAADGKAEDPKCLLEDKDSGEVETYEMPGGAVACHALSVEGSGFHIQDEATEGEKSEACQPKEQGEQEGDGTVAETDETDQQREDQTKHLTGHTGDAAAPADPSAVPHTETDTPMVKEQLASGDTGSQDSLLSSSEDLNHHHPVQAPALPPSSEPEQEKQGADEGPLASSSGLGTELDDFFAASSTGVAALSKPEESQAEKAEEVVSGRSQTGFFPALDNVDLETDEELVEMEKMEEVGEVVEAEKSEIEGGLGSREDYPENLTCGTQLSNDPEEIVHEFPPRVSPTEAGSSVRMPPPEHAAYPHVGHILHHLEDLGHQDLPAGRFHTTSSSKSEERPPAPALCPSSKCLDNYDVCRELQPGVKECLVMETGEQFICVNPPSDGLGLEPQKGSSVYLVQTNSSRDFPRDGSRISLESPFEVPVGEDDVTPQLYRTTHPTMLRVDHVLSPSEAFAYVSFDDDGGSSEGHRNSSPKHSEDYTRGKSLDGKQQAYITHNGIPIIMDNAETDVKEKTYRRDDAGDRLRRYEDLGGRWADDDLYVHGTRQRHRTTVDLRQNREELGRLLASNTHKKYTDIFDRGQENYLWKKKKNKAKQRRKKEEDEVMIVLEPVEVTDHSEDGGTLTEPRVSGLAGPPPPAAAAALESVSLNLNNNRLEGEEEEVEGHEWQNENNSANDRLSKGAHGKSPSRKESSKSGVRSSSSRSHHPDQSSDYQSYRPRSDASAYHSPTYRHSASRSSYLEDSSDYRSRDWSSLHRSGESGGPVDSSRLSTRYMRLDRGDSHSSATRAESSMVPRFNTLHDQQMSWLDMFKMIEAQHRTELRSQHEQHERLLQEMQQNMARELSKQQDTLKHSLSAHREILEELSPGRHREPRQNKNQSRQFDDVERSSVDSQQSVESVGERSSHTTLQGVDVSLRNPPPLSRYSELFDRDPNDVPVKRSLESELGSPSRPADTSLGQSRVSVGRNKQLRGGVYSSPMPLAKSKHKNSPRATKSSSDATVSSSPKDDKSRNANSSRNLQGEARHDVLAQAFPGSADVSQAESEDFLSPRTRISLREKHARHLADQRAYYEEELREMRQMLLASQRKLERGSGDGGNTVQGQHTPPQPVGRSMEEQILGKENEELRQRCRELQDEYHDSKSEIRELQQKIQGLEIRAADYAERYDQSQTQVLNLGSRLEELTEFAKEKESTSSDLEAKNKRVAESLQMAYKKEKELTESLHSAKTTIQRLVDKYEILEKDYTLLKESSAVSQEKLLTTRHEAMEANNKLSRLEMDNKQLQHDNEILKHELTMARSSLSMRTSYEDSYSPSHSREQGRANHASTSSSVRARSKDRSQQNSSPLLARKGLHRGASPEESSLTPAEDLMRSPILRAEQELRKLQGSSGADRRAAAAGRTYSPKLQRKFYGTELPTHNTGVSPNNRSRNSFSPTSKSRSSLEKKGQSGPKGRSSGNRGGNTTPNGATKSSPASKAEPFNFITERERSTLDSNLKASDLKSRELGVEKDRNSSIRTKPSVTTNGGMSGELAMERIKLGDIVSRPEWEDMYTSMAPSRSGHSAVDRNVDRTATRDQILQERVRNIDNLEKKYDTLVTQKRKYESSLSKLPLHGHRGEKERLEAELDCLDKELGSVRMSLKRFHVLKSTI